MDIRVVLAVAPLVLLAACSSSNSSSSKLSTGVVTAKAGELKLSGSSDDAKKAAQFLIDKKLVQKSNDGKLVLAAANFNGSSTGNSGYDAGMNALKTGAISNPVFSGVKGYYGDTSDVFLRDPAAAGFEYQTFGQVFDQRGSLGYVSVGHTYSPADTANITATYKGGAMGTFDGASEVISDMTAKLNWGASAKTLEVTTSNSHISTNNIANTRYTPISKDTRFDFTETMTWNAAESQFKNNNATGRLYGKNEASEVGGTIDKVIDGKTYLGAYGGVKQ